ncbi:MAG: methylamine utilization protein [Paraglaciecola sp.]|uniref:methylamine utilization protein n=1 Tax=Paraglaciecola sp. TaxID=1920173 RepID=UPI00329A29FF
MTTRKFGRVFLKTINNSFCFTFIAVILFDPVVMAKTLYITDQFNKPIENVVVSFATTKPTQADNVKLLVMDQIDKQFSPRLLVVQKNQRVSFPNSDNIRHHLYSFSKPKPFEFRMFKGGDTKELVFDQAGIVVLGCNIHDQMVGYIYVADNEQTVVSNKHGLAEVPENGLMLKLWHPNLSTNKILRKNFQLPETSLEAPFPIVLNLLEDTVIPTQRTFKSKKFDRGNN